MRIAIIGSGISGLAASWALGKHHAVTLFEKDARLGGHAHTVDVDYDGTRIAVDTGFIVYNTVNYPNLVRLFDTLGVASEPSDMSFGVSFGRGRLEWAGDSIATLFAQKRNLVSPSHHAMWLDIVRFNKRAATDIGSGMTDGLSLGAYLGQCGFSAAFRDRYLLPMGAAIWSMPNGEMLNFPVRRFLEFFENHGLLSGFNTFQWRTVSGGSRAYVRKIAAAIDGDVRTGRGVARVTRTDGGVEVVDVAGHASDFDQVVFACHSDQALAVLGDASRAERDVLGAIRYAPNRAVLHRDPSLMPRRKAVWSSWNYINDDAPGVSLSPVSLTYWMNRLQNIDRRMPLFVTLNPAREPAPELTFAAFDYAHPQFDHAAEVAQRRLKLIQGMHRTWFCGAYCGHGFHEDGLTSALEIAARLGAEPWSRTGRPRIFNALSQAAE